MIKRSANWVDLADLLQKISTARKISKVSSMNMWFLVFEGVSIGLTIESKTRLQPFLFHRICIAGRLSYSQK